MKRYFTQKFISSVMISLVSTIVCLSLVGSVQAQGSVTLKNNATSQTQTFSTIQQALDFSTSNSWNNITVTLVAATYAGNVTIKDVSQSVNESITLQGQGSSSTQINGTLSIGKYNGVTLSQLSEEADTDTLGDNSALTLLNSTMTAKKDISIGSYVDLAVLNNSQLKTGGDIKTGQNISMYAKDSSISIGGSLQTVGVVNFAVNNTPLTISGNFIGGSINTLSLNNSPLTVGGTLQMGATTDFTDNALSSSQGVISIGKDLDMGDGSYVNINNEQVTHETIGGSMQLGNSVYLNINNIDIDIINNFVTGNNDQLTLKNSHITYGGNFTQGANNTISLDATSSITKSTLLTEKNIQWAGYAAVTSSANQTYNDVKGSWIVPSSNCSVYSPQSAFWVGLGGIASGGTSTNGFLEQIGTGTDCFLGFTRYYPLYQIYSQGKSTGLVNIHNMNSGDSINPGDYMTGEVRYATGTTYQLKLTNHTQNWVFQQDMVGSDQNDARSSAEWMAEDPTAKNNSIPPLADFDEVHFFDCAVDGSPITSSSIVDYIPMWTWVKNQIVSPPLKAYPLPLSTDGTSFFVKFINP